MTHAEICPVCKGKGYLQEIVTTDFGRDTTSPPSQESSTLTQRVCHGCNGRGWVEVSDYPCYPYYPYYPRYPYYPYYPYPHDQYPPIKWTYTISYSS
jgi:hypothetical protein